MSFSKRTLVVSLCFCLLITKPAKAFWPVFDFTEIVPIYSQVSTGINQLKNLKEQLKELEETLKSVGKEVNNLSAFGKSLTNLVTNAADVVNQASNAINQNLKTNLDVTNKTEDLTNKVSSANKQVAEAIVDTTNKTIDKNTLTENTDKEGNRIPKNNDEIKSYDIEEEEEEEEVSKAEENAQIEAVKENINFALEESKAISVQFNDVLDVSINTIHQNIEKNNTMMDKMIFVIEKAENLTDEDKEILAKEVTGFKQRQENLSINLVGIIEGIKDSYNKSYKSKIEDGYKNYEKVAIAYIRGDTKKEEFLFAGKKLKTDINSIDIAPDKGVMNGVKIAINSLQKEIGDLGKKIRKIEEVNKKYNS